MHRLMPLFLLAACGGESSCDEGWVDLGEGHCGLDADALTPDLQPLLDADPCPSGLSGDGSLDLDAFCAGQACAGGTLADFEAEFGTNYDDAVAPFLIWDDPAVFASFDDANGNGQVDADETANWLSLEGGALDIPWDGTTADGRGLGIPLSCWLGDPAPYEVVARRYPDGWSLDQLSFWTDAGLLLVSSSGGRGTTESITLLGL
ncbi:MAG: hypothetical protein EP330_26960 [Deltaproteobacteria bacterium]|nr:MAG: hypothetical protein EP330_26960 [Deltaproteobacteria bacterium]